MPIAALVTDSYWVEDGGATWPIHPGWVLVAHGAGWVIALLLTRTVAWPAPVNGFMRSLKLALWTSVIWIPALATAAGVIYWCKLEWWIWYSRWGATLLTAVGAITLVLWLAVTRRLVVHPVTADEELAQRTVEPICVQCSYSLLGHTTADACPECAWPVRASLQVDGEDAPWAVAGGWRRAAAWFATTRLVLTRRSFFARLRTWDVRDAGLGYLMATGVIAAVPLVAVAVTTILTRPTAGWPRLAPAVMACLSAAAWMLFAFVFGAHALVAIRSHGSRCATRALWTASCYGSALALPPIAVAYCLVWVYLAVGGVQLDLLILDYYSWPELGTELAKGGGIAVLLLTAGLVVSVVLGVRRFLRGVTEARLGETLTARSRASR